MTLLLKTALGDEDCEKLQEHSSDLLSQLCSHEKSKKDNRSRLTCLVKRMHINDLFCIQLLGCHRIGRGRERRRADQVEDDSIEEKGEAIWNHEE